MGKHIFELLLTSVISSGIVGVFFTFFFNKRLENHRQELSKDLQRYSLYEQEKHKVYREYYKDLMHAQSAVRVKVERNHAQSKNDLNIMNKYIMQLNNNIINNALYFSEELFEEAFETKNTLVDIMLMKNEIFEGIANEETLINVTSEIKSIEHKLIVIKRNLKLELEN